MSTNFVWATVVTGEKQTLTDMQDRQRKLAQEQQKLAHEQRKEQRRIVPPSTIAATVAATVAADTYVAWKYATYKTFYDDKYEDVNKVLEIPANVNERAMHFIERFLATFPEEAQKCTTVGEFKRLFQNLYVPFIRVHYPRQYHAKKIDYDYYSIQKWVADEEQVYTSDKAKGMHFPPPWLNPMWVFAKNVTFENCLWALNVVSKTFKMDQVDENGVPFTGYLRIVGNPQKTDSRIEWLDNLSTYKPFMHQRKSKSRRYDQVADHVALYD